MREELQMLCDDFLQRKELVKSTFIWESSYIYPICASIVMDKERVTAEELNVCKQLIKENTGIFSEFRGSIISPMACKMAVAEQGKELLSSTLEIYNMLRKDYASGSYLPLVAQIIAEYGDKEEYAEIVKKAKAIYENMKENHPFLTSGEDGPFAAMLAFCEKSTKLIMQEMEQCYELLKDYFYSANSVQSLSQVLVMGEGTIKEKCEKFLKVFEELKTKGYKYSTDYYLSTLGALSILPIEVKTLVEDIIDVTDYLEGKPGYGFLGSSKKERMMHASILVSKEYTKKCLGQIVDSTMIGSTVGAIAVVVAQQAAMCAVMATTVASTIND